MQRQGSRWLTSQQRAGGRRNDARDDWTAADCLQAAWSRLLEEPASSSLFGSAAQATFPGHNSRFSPADRSTPARPSSVRGVKSVSSTALCSCVRRDALAGAQALGPAVGRRGCCPANRAGPHHVGGCQLQPCQNKQKTASAPLSIASPACSAFMPPKRAFSRPTLRIAACQRQSVPGPRKRKTGDARLVVRIAAGCPLILHAALA